MTAPHRGLGVFDPVGIAGVTLVQAPPAKAQVSPWRQGDPIEQGEVIDTPPKRTTTPSAESVAAALPNLGEGACGPERFSQVRRE